MSKGRHEAKVAEEARAEQTGLVSHSKELGVRGRPEDFKRKCDTYSRRNT